MGATSLPFTTRVIHEKKGAENARKAADFSECLPATYRTKEDHIIVPSSSVEFLESELLVNKLNRVQDWLWICGRPMPPRPLHYQKLIARDIAITESPELHLVWIKNQIYLKPMPLYLLDPDFWKAFIVHDDDPRQQHLASCARGFLFSYTALIAYESDFRIAMETGLLPRSLTWNDWKTLTREILDSHCYATVNPRYWYGELRLTRLNTIFRLKGSIFRGYSRVGSPNDYMDLIRDHFAVVASILGYVVIVLTAMQVGLGVERLQTDAIFQNASYGFTVFSIVAPLIATAVIMGGVFTMFVSNWMVTKRYEVKRFQEMGVEAFWRTQPGKRVAPPAPEGDKKRGKV
jgi:hypothetical protein